MDESTCSPAGAERSTAVRPAVRTCQVEAASRPVDGPPLPPPRLRPGANTAPTAVDFGAGRPSGRGVADLPASRALGGDAGIAGWPLLSAELPELLRVDEAAAFLRLTPAAVRQRICRGQLAALKLGPAPRDPTERDRRAVRIPRSALLAFLGLPVDSCPAQSDGPPVARRHCQGGS